MSGLSESDRQIDELAEEHATYEYAAGIHWELATVRRMAEDRALKSLDGSARYYYSYAAVIDRLMTEESTTKRHTMVPPVRRY